MLKVKLLSRGKSITPYIAKVTTNGRIQKAFAEKIGRPVGACVAGKVHKGMNQSDIKQAVRDCAKASKGVKL